MTTEMAAAPKGGVEMASGGAAVNTRKRRPAKIMVEVRDGDTWCPVNDEVFPTTEAAKKSVKGDPRPGSYRVIRVTDEFEVKVETQQVVSFS
jgi:hypothetical protein